MKYMAVSTVTKYETVIYIYYVIFIQDLTRRKITPGIDWAGLEELKVKSWPSSDRFPVESGRNKKPTPVGAFDSGRRPESIAPTPVSFTGRSDRTIYIM